MKPSTAYELILEQLNTITQSMPEEDYRKVIRMLSEEMESRVTVIEDEEGIEELDE